MAVKATLDRQLLNVGLPGKSNRRTDSTAAQTGGCLGTHHFCHNIVHADTGMAFVIHAFAIFDQEYLWGFMVNSKRFSHLRRKLAMTDQVEKIEIHIWRGRGSFQPALGHATDGAAGAVFKDHLWGGTRFFFDGGYL